jgi:hypothetical protein
MFSALQTDWEVERAGMGSEKSTDSEYPRLQFLGLCQVAGLLLKI